MDDSENNVRATVQQVALNIYLKQFDEYMKEYAERLTKLGIISEEDGEDIDKMDLMAIEMLAKIKNKTVSNEDWEFFSKKDSWVTCMHERLYEIGNKILDYMLAITHPKYERYSFEELLSKSMNGDDDALMVITKLYKGIIEFDFVKIRIQKAEAEQDYNFLDRFGKAFSASPGFKKGDIKLAWWLKVEEREKAETLTDKELARLASEKFKNPYFDHDYIKTVRRRLGILKRR